MKALANEIYAVMEPHKSEVNENNAVKRWCKDNNHEFLGSGSARVAVRIGDKVIKVARRGYEHHNLQEQLVWRSTQGTPVRSWLGEVVLTHPEGNWLISRYAGKTLPLTTEGYAIIRKHAERLIKLGFTPEDVHPQNFTVDGKFIDYADCYPLKKV
jgi:hypothetical protein